MIGYFGIAQVLFIIVWLGIAIYLITLAARLVKAVEKIADNFENK